MTKPFMNLDEVEFDDIEGDGTFTSRRRQISDHIGAKKLGNNYTIVPPGKTQFPFHNHQSEEELFVILEGEGQLRFGDRHYEIRANDIIPCLPGGPEFAHQIINAGSTPMRYLSISTNRRPGPMGDA